MQENILVLRSLNKNNKIAAVAYAFRGIFQAQPNVAYSFVFTLSHRFKNHLMQNKLLERNYVYFAKEGKGIIFLASFVYIQAKENYHLKIARGFDHAIKNSCNDGFLSLCKQL